MTHVRNQQFSHYSRSSSFAVTLNEASINELLSIFRWESYVESGPHPDQCIHSTDPNTYGASVSRSLQNYLQRRGLIVSCEDPSVSENFVLTNTGKLMSMLLMDAGFSFEQKNRVCSTSFAYNRYQAQLKQRKIDMDNFLKENPL